MKILDTFKVLDTARLNSLEESIELRAMGRVLSSEYEGASLPVPDYLRDGLKALTRDIESRRKDALELRRRELLAQASTLETQTEKRERIKNELSDIDKQLEPAGSAK